MNFPPTAFQLFAGHSPLTLHFWKAEKWVGQKNGLSDVPTFAASAVAAAAMEDKSATAGRSAPPYFRHPHSARQSVLIRGL